MTDDRAQLAAAVLHWCEQQGPQGIVITDASLRVSVWNQWMTDTTGITQDAAVGRPLFEVVPSLLERGFDQYYRAALTGQVKVLSHAFHRSIVPTSGRRLEQMPQAGRIFPLQVGETTVGTMTIIEDVSERVASDRELRGRIATAETASRVKDEFLATLSHEIRTPLNAVLGWTRILRARHPVDEPTLARAVEVIDRNASAQLTLITDMLDMARISSGKVRLEMATVDLGAIALAAADVVRPAADAKGVRLVTDLAPHLPTVSGDHDRLLQVAWNLLSNAVKFTDSGGQVTVVVAPVGNAVVLSVTDSGKGIDAAFLPHVFERFRQADPSSSRRHGGLGLGLSLVKNLVELHGGTVKVSSPGTGQGSAFEVALPARDGPVTAAAVLPDVGPASSGGVLAGLRIALVDDDPDAAEICIRALNDVGAITEWSRSVAQTLSRLREGPPCPHVIISDIGMPDEDGYSLIRQLRTLRPEFGGQLPVIALTAYDSPEDRARALRSGFEAHIPKPFDTDALIAAILQAMSGSHTE
jgi:PAS domain S-box-containing protein